MANFEERTFFIFGLPKSGTTWLQILLNAHPQIVCRSEDQFDFFLKQVPELLTAYNRVLKETDRRTARQGPTYFKEGDARTLIKTVILLALSKGLGPPEVRCVGAKDNAIIRNLPFYAELFGHSKFVFIVRDPRDIAVSSWFHNLRVEDDFLARARDMPSWTEGTAQNWRTRLEAVERAAANMAGRFMSVRYEDLHAEPEQRVMGLLSFLGVDADRETARACLEASDFSVLSGGRASGQEDRESFYRMGMVGDWKSHLDDATVARVKAAAGAVMERYGYA